MSGLLDTSLEFIMRAPEDVFNQYACETDFDAWWESYRKSRWPVVNAPVPGDWCEGQKELAWAAWSAAYAKALA